MSDMTNSSEPARLLRVIPFGEWCKLRSISPATGYRIRKAGKIKITHLSERRIGVREDHDREFLDNCARASA